MEDEDNTIKVNSNILKLSVAMEDKMSLGHPAVYYTFDESNKIICSYCGKTIC